MSDCKCIFTHKPDINKFKIGEKWVCPTCRKIFTRVDEVYLGDKVAWVSENDYASTEGFEKNIYRSLNDNINNGGYTVGDGYRKF